MIRLKERLDAYEHLMRLKQPVGFLLVLWPTLSALWIASSGAPPVSSIMILFTGSLLIRSAGCVLTEWGDRHTASHESSPIIQGIIKPYEALLLAFVLCALTLCFICMTTKTAIILFFVFIAFLVAYMLLRHIILLPQALLGILFSFGIPIAFAITLDEVSWIAWALMGVNMFWAIAYEIEYTMAARENGTLSGFQSTAVTFGKHDVLIVAFCYFCFFAGLAFFGVYWGWSWAFWLAMAAAVLVAFACLACIWTRDLHRCAKAFQRNHWIGMLVFLGIAANYALQYQAWPLLHQ